MASRLVSGKSPLPGTDRAADAIYARRGPARGITALDATLLNCAPDIVLGYSALLDGIRTKGRLPASIREAMILRIAALNYAAYEWIQHVEIGRKAGLSTGQLYVIRDVDTPLLLPSSPLLGPLLAAAIRFTDGSTRLPISLDVGRELKEELRKWALDQHLEDLDGFYVEAAMVVAAYNMVSRILVSTDVGGLSDVSVPWPVEREERFVSVPSFPPSEEPTHQIHTITLTRSASAPWLVFANSLNTDWRMWNYVVPILLDRLGCNILLHSQRGHGLSTLPLVTESEPRLTPIPLLATDINHLLETLAIPTPVECVIGVSQGGATALAFAALFGERTRSVVVCDTAGKTPAGNKQAWEERTALVCGTSSDGWWQAETQGNNIDIEAYAEKVGMRKLAKVTVPRWFPEGSRCHPGSELDSDGRIPWLEEMIAKTDVKGFFHGAKALGSYDVLEIAEDGKTKRLFETGVEKVLLVAGSLDGGGKVAKGLRRLREEWISSGRASVEFVEIEESGHLPMIDSPSAFCEAVVGFLSSDN